MRVSHYSVASDPLDDESVVLFSTTFGTLDRVSAAEAGFLEATRNLTPDAQDRALRALPREARESLLERGHLTDQGPDDEHAFANAIVDALHEGATGMPSFMIVPNLDCNYRCTYCFERPMQKTIRIASSEISHQRSNVVMTPAMVDAAFRAIGEIEAQTGSRAPHLVLYGGEPLDRTNLDIVRCIVERAEREGRYFSAISNGHDLVHFADLLGPTRIAEVQVSFDGLREQHDRTRVSLSKTSSFDTIVAAITHVLKETRVQVQLRLHVEPHNIDTVEHLLAFFEARGWLDSERVVAYANVVYRKDQASAVSTMVTASELATRFRLLQKRYPMFFPSAPAVHAARTIADAILENRRAGARASYCAANTGNYIFAPDGAIYACWESIGKACSRLGTFEAGRPSLIPSQVQKWFTRKASTIPQCSTCAYKLVCGGGCAQFAEYNHGDQQHAYCDDFQATFRQALATTTETILIDA